MQALRRFAQLETGKVNCISVPCWARASLWRCMLRYKRQRSCKRPPGSGTMQNVLRDIPHSRLYVELRELDLRIEQYSNRKKAEIRDVSQAQDLQMRCLRLQFFNRHYNQVRLPASSSY
jgi:hypothetical protein